ncbi:MAG: CoA-binding protein [Actinomycetota bacterium]
MDPVAPLSEDELRQIYADTKTIAVVGMSGNPEKDAHEIPRYLQSQGYRIIPVNPRGGELLGERVFTSLDEIEEPIDVVDVFRPSEEAADVARAAVAVKPHVLWFQLDCESEEGVRIGQEAGLTVVWGRCMGATHRQLGLGPGPWQDS